MKLENLNDLEQLLGYCIRPRIEGNYCALSLDWTKEVARIDPNEQIAHIDWTSTHPVTWEKQSWISCEKKRAIEKFSSAVSRLMSNNLTERYNTISRAFIDKMKCNEESIRDIAMSFVKSPNSKISGVMQAYGLHVNNLAELLTIEQAREIVTKQIKRESKLPRTTGIGIEITVNRDDTVVNPLPSPTAKAIGIADGTSPLHEITQFMTPETIKLLQQKGKLN